MAATLLGKGLVKTIFSTSYHIWCLISTNLLGQMVYDKSSSYKRFFYCIPIYILSNTIKDDPITKITTEFVYAIHLLHHNFIPQQVILPGCECSVNSRVGTSPSTVWAEKIDTVKKEIGHNRVNQKSLEVSWVSTFSFLNAINNTT